MGYAEKLRGHFKERRFPKPMLPQGYDHDGVNFASPGQEAILSRLRTKYTTTPSLITPMEMMEVITGEIDDIRSQKEAFELDPDPAVEKWKQQRQWIRNAADFFQKQPHQQRYLILNHGDGPKPYTIRRTDMELLLPAATVDPFERKIEELTAVRETLASIFGLNDEPYQDEYAISNVYRYIHDQRDRWKKQTEVVTLAEEVDEATFNLGLFSEFENKIPKATDAAKYQTDFTGIEEHLGSLYFPTRYDHNQLLCESPLQEQFIRKRTHDRLSEEPATADDLSGIIKPEMQDLRDQETAFRTEPAYTFVLNDPGAFDEHGSLTFFANQRTELTTLLGYITNLEYPIGEPDTARKDAQIKQLKTYIERVRRRFLEKSGSDILPANEGNFFAELKGILILDRIKTKKN